MEDGPDDIEPVAEVEAISSGDEEHVHSQQAAGQFIIVGGG